MHDGHWRLLTDPDGQPTAKQLLKLNRLGALELVQPGEAGSRWMVAEPRI